MRVPSRPPLDGLKRQLDRSRERGDRMERDGFVRETFRLPRVMARAKAREFLDRYPRAAYWSEVESWQEWPGDVIEFTMRRLKSAD
ncbi:MAG: hypothetical protein KDJ73_13080 [Notoacmeibacter sp.]|nr:hypothetical protein [Notoacmeibacter sp.]MCC0033381.1 hypothetical protein [Brucellaceae bacterium]